MDPLQVICELDYLYWQLSEVEKAMKDTRKPIERMVDEACGVPDPFPEHAKTAMKLLRMIQRRKKKLGMDTAESDKEIAKFSKALKAGAF